MLSKIRTFIKDYLIEGLMRWLLCDVYGMSIGRTSRISTKAFLDRTNPKGIHIGERCMITGNVVVLTHKFLDGDGVYVDTFIGDDVFIGMNSIILPGVKIGSRVVVGAGSVVTKDVPSDCVVAGNPAKVLQYNAKIGPYGRWIKDV